MSVDLIVGGASKAGTTALYDMLRQRPDFFLPKRKELHYFSRPFFEGTTNGPGDAAVLAEIPDTLDTYFAHFADKRPGQIAVDVSPSYLIHHASAAAIERELPSVKIVFILRRPEEKVFSQYTHLVGEGRETMSFEDALGAEANRKAAGYSDIWLYAESGYYADAVMAFQAALGPGRTMIVLFDDFRRDPGSVLRDICLFVGLDGRQEFRTELESNVSGAPRSVLLARLIGPNAFTNLLRPHPAVAIGPYCAACFARSQFGWQADPKSRNPQHVEGNIRRRHFSARNTYRAQNRLADPQRMTRGII